MSLCRSLRRAILFLALFGSSAHSKSSFLSDTLIRKDQVHNVMDYEPVSEPSCQNAVLTGPIETTLCDYETMESVNDQLFENLTKLVNLPFFRYFQVDLYRDCPFWPDNGSCNDPGCAITTIDESNIPEKWRAKALSEVDPESIDKRHSMQGCYYHDSDFCFLEDNPEGDYFDLRLVPERYTGYSGKDAQRVWRSIYEENCFGLSELSLMTSKSPAPVSLPDTMIEVLHDDGKESDPHCLEKRVYYKVISGLHTSISTHICHEYLNQTTGQWHPNLQCFISRVASHPERLQYLYFDTILLLRAVSRLGPYLSAFDYCSSGNTHDDSETVETLSKVIDIANYVGKFDETVLFRGENANVLKEEFKTHFRNVTRIMDCVGCDKCRLWGKVQTTGIATALKVLFELDEKALDLHTNANLLQRSEIVALMNTLFRFSESLKAVDGFRQMWHKLDAESSQRFAEETERTTAHHEQPDLTPLTDDNKSETLFDSACSKSKQLFQSCKESLTDPALDVLNEAMEGVLSAFRPSGKENGPGAMYGDL